MQESSLTWFDYVRRRAINAQVRKNKLIQIKGTKKCRGMIKITLVEVIKKTCQLRK